MAKHRSFKIEKFVAGVKSELLKEYFTRKNVPVPEGLVFDRNNIHDFLDGISDEGKRSYIHSKQ